MSDVSSVLSTRVRKMRLFCIGLLLAVIGISTSAVAQGIPGKFDYYTLTQFLYNPGGPKFSTTMWQNPPVCLCCSRVVAAV